MIPRKIHYCWFGSQEKSQNVKECMATWPLKTDYLLKEWNETNCDFSANKFVRQAVEQKKWAFVSDYFRLVALYNEGGIYLDTDVELTRNFDTLLTEKFFVGYIFDSSIGTAVMGSVKHHRILGDLIDLYEEAYWDDDYKNFYVKRFGNINFTCNNDLLTYYLKTEYSDFKLNGKTQHLNDFSVYSKEEFEIGPIIGKKHALHRCEGSWKDDKDSRKKIISSSIKRMAARIPLINVESCIRHTTYAKKMKNERFYDLYLRDTENK